MAMKYKTHDAGKIKIKTDQDDLKEGQFIAYASTWTRTPDCYGDVVAKGAFTDTLREWKDKGTPIPILYGHDETDPNKNIGYVVEAVEDEHGLKIHGQLDTAENPDARQVWRLLKGHRLTQMSFGYTVTEETMVDTPTGAANELRAVKLYEVSIVPRGANPDTSIEAVKAADATPVPSLPLPNTATATLQETETSYKAYLDKVDALAAESGTKGATQIAPHANEVHAYLKELHDYLAKLSDGLNLKAIAEYMPQKASLIRRRANLEGRELSYSEKDFLEHAAEEQQAARGTLAKLEEGTKKLQSLMTGKDYTDMEDEHEDNYSVKKIGNTYVGPGLDRGRLDLRAIAKAAPAAMISYSQSRGLKSGLDLSGSTMFGVPVVNTTPFADAAGEIPPSLLDYLTTVKTSAPEYDILVQNTPADPGAAAVVPKGEAKPQYKLGLTKERHALKVIAVMSEPLDKYLFRDAETTGGNALLDFVGNTLTRQIWATLENEILEGDGTENHLTGLAKVSGTKTQAYKGNAFDTVAAALASIQMQNIAPRIIALNPADWLAMCTAKDNNGRYMTNNIVDASAARLFGVQVAPTPGLAAGTGWVLGNESLALATDGVIHAEWNEGGTLFERNEVIFRVESRFSLDVYKPHALCQFSLVDAKA